MGWRSELKRRRDDEARAVAVLQEEDLPLCGEKIRGLYWIAGFDGLYVEHHSGVKAFDAARRNIVILSRIEGEALGNYLELQDLGANLAWAAVNTCEVCKRVIRDCHCNDYPETDI